MFRKLREKQAAMAAASTDVPRAALFLKLLDEGYSSNEAGVVAKACHPFLGQQPNNRPFEDVMRQTAIAFAMQTQNLAREEEVELALTTLGAYREMAVRAGDGTYVAWFTDALEIYHRGEETDNPQPEPAQDKPAPRRREPLRAKRS